MRAGVSARRGLRWCLAAGLAGCLAGCLAVGPDYRRPDLEAPAGWSAPPDAGQDAGRLEEAAWWKAFGDPVLDELVARGLAGNLDIAQAKARVRAARADVVTTRAGLFPAIDVAGSSTTNASGPLNAGSGTVANSDGTAASTTAGTSSTTNTVFSAGFDAAWELDFFGGTRRAAEAAKASLEASREAVGAARLTLLGDVAANYLALRGAQEQLDIARRSAAAKRQNVEITRERFRLGLGTRLDVAQAEGQAAATEADIPSLESAIKAGIHRLGILLGLPPAALTPLLAAPRPLPELNGPLLAAGLPSELLLRRPDLRRAERQLAAAAAAVGQATAALYPKFDLTAGLGLQGGSPSKAAGFSTWYWSVIPGLSWPLFDAGKARAAVDKKKAAYGETLAAYKAAFHTALEDVENALAAYYAEKERGGQLEASVGAFDEAVALAEERYVKGLANFLAVLVNQASLYEAKTRLSKSRTSLLTAVVGLYKALGGGWKAAATAVAEME